MKSDGVRDTFQFNVMERAWDLGFESYSLSDLEGLVVRNENSDTDLGELK